MAGQGRWEIRKTLMRKAEPVKLRRMVLWASWRLLGWVMAGMALRADAADLAEQHGDAVVGHGGDYGGAYGPRQITG